jgi:hypothetical protein
MMTLHCSHALTRELAVADVAIARANNTLGDWYAVSVTAARYPQVLAVNSRSLLVVAFPLANPGDLVAAFQQAVAHLLLRLGLTTDELEQELIRMSPTLIRSTRRVDIPGKLYAAVAHARGYLRHHSEESSLLELEDRLARTPRQSLLGRTPAEATLAAFRHSAEVIELDAYRARRKAQQR